MSLMQEMTAREGEEIIEDRPDAPRHERKERRENFSDEKRERKPRRQREEYSGPEEGMVQLFLSLGKRDNISAGDIVGMLHNECHLERGTVGRIRLLPNFSFVEVAKDSAPKAIDLSSHARLRGKGFKLDYDKGPGAGGGGPRGGGGGGYRGGGERRERRDRNDRRGKKSGRRDRY
ncbi:MAG: DbpA RNA binding domain-containing protein [Planctomycetota bacterium]